jgi:putative ABC transport system permease protein
MFQTLRMAAGNLISHGRRSLLVGGSVTAVTAIVLVSLGVVNAARQNLFEITTGFISGHVNVAGIHKRFPAFAEQVLVNPEEVEAVLRQRLPELASMNRRVIGMVGVVSQRASVPWLLLVGVDVDNPDVRRLLRVEAGQLEALKQPNTVLLFSGQAETLKLQLGETADFTGSTVRGRRTVSDFTVGAIAGEAGGISKHIALASPETVARFFGLPEGATNVLELRFEEGTRDYAALQARVSTVLQEELGLRLVTEDHWEWADKQAWAESEPWTGQAVEVRRWDEAAGPQPFFLSALDLLIALVAMLLLAVSCVGLVNSLWVAIRERMQEIGAMRAMGMQRERVVGLFLGEGLLLGLLGALAGGLLAAAVALSVNLVGLPVPHTFQVFLGMGTQVRIGLDPVAALVVMALITACVTAASVLPSWAASRVRPVTAMQRG